MRIIGYDGWQPPAPKMNTAWAFPFRGAVTWSIYCNNAGDALWQSQHLWYLLTHMVIINRLTIRQLVESSRRQGGHLRKKCIKRRGLTSLSTKACIQRMQICPVRHPPGYQKQTSRRVFMQQTREKAVSTC
eukprot:1158845-Pelagomonas_calceolata.AAC.5